MMFPSSPEQIASHPDGRNGFTLIELLTVTAIVAILAVLAFSASNAVFLMQEKPRSIARLRLLTQGSIAYSADNDGRIPTWGYDNATHSEPRWQNVLIPNYIPYSKGVSYWRDCDYLGCEVQRRMAKMTGTSNHSTFHLNGDIGYYVGPEYGADFARTVQELEAPSKTALFMHGVWNGLYGDAAVFSKTDANRYGERMTNTVFGDYVLISFCDGSVQLRNPANTNEVPHNNYTAAGKLFWNGKSQ